VKPFFFVNLVFVI